VLGGIAEAEHNGMPVHQRAHRRRELRVRQAPAVARAHRVEQRGAPGRRELAGEAREDVAEVAGPRWRRARVALPVGGAAQREAGDARSLG
jgi:hypothetical protein